MHSSLDCFPCYSLGTRKTNSFGKITDRTHKQNLGWKLPHVVRQLKVDLNTQLSGFDTKDHVCLQVSWVAPRATLGIFIRVLVTVMGIERLTFRCASPQLNSTSGAQALSPVIPDIFWHRALTSYHLSSSQEQAGRAHHGDKDGDWNKEEDQTLPGLKIGLVQDNPGLLSAYVLSKGYLSF